MLPMARSTSALLVRKLIQYELVPATYLVSPSMENLVPLVVDLAAAVGRDSVKRKRESSPRPEVMMDFMVEALGEVGGRETT